MEAIRSSMDPSDAQFQHNSAHQRSLVDDLRQQLGRVRAGGGEKYRQRHESQGKLFVRERIIRLLDQGSPFLELSPLAAYQMYEDQAPGAGIVTGTMPR